MSKFIVLALSLMALDVVACCFATLRRTTPRLLVFAFTSGLLIGCSLCKLIAFFGIDGGR